MIAKKRKALSILLVLAMIITLSPTSATVSMADESPTGGWINEVQSIDYGVAHTDMLSETDYMYKLKWNHICDAYRFNMRSDAKLTIYFESSEQKYFGKNYSSSYENLYLIYSVDDPDTKITSLARTGTYSSARNVYMSTSEISLPIGEYYLLVDRSCSSSKISSITLNTPYTITLNYDENPVNVSALILNKSELSLGIGASETLTATVVPENATDKSLIWESSNPNVVSVSDGVVTGISAGRATITVYSADRVMSAEAVVTVGSSASATATPSRTATPSTTAAPSRTAAPSQTSSPSDDSDGEPEEAYTPTPTPETYSWTPSADDYEEFENSQARILSLRGMKKAIQVKISYSSSIALYQYAGYEYQYKLGKNGKWKTRTSPNEKIKLKKFKSGRIYYVRVRPYTDWLVYDVGIWSPVSWVKTK